MITIVFRTCLRPDAELAELKILGARMAELAAAIPDFVLYKDFAADDGEAISLIEFKSLETLAAWRDHPKPLSAQARGREAFFAANSIQVCDTLRACSFP